MHLAFCLQKLSHITQSLGRSLFNQTYKSFSFFHSWYSLSYLSSSVSSRSSTKIPYLLYFLIRTGCSTYVTTIDRETGCWTGTVSLCVTGKLTTHSVEGFDPSPKIDEPRSVGSSQSIKGQSLMASSLMSRTSSMRLRVLVNFLACKGVIIPCSSSSLISSETLVSSSLEPMLTWYTDQGCE